jgi:hypothetical protein
MTFELEAACPAEGIGIVRSRGTLRLVRPPYALSDAAVLPEESLQDAIARHGFHAARQQFASWEEVIAFLESETVSARRSVGKMIPDSIAAKDILDVAPLDVLTRFLDRVEREVIPQRLFEQAEDFLLALLESNAPSRYPQTSNRAVELLKNNHAQRRRAEAGVSTLGDHDVRFRGLEKSGELELSAQLAARIRERGCIFAPAS